MSVCTTCLQHGLPADGRHDCPGLGEIGVSRERGRGVVVDHAPQRALIGLHIIRDLAWPANIAGVGDPDLVNIADQVLYRVVGYDAGSAALVVELVEDWRPPATPRPAPCGAVHPVDPSARCDKPSGHDDGEHSGETNYLYRLNWPAEAVDATVCTPIPAETLMQMSEVPPELLTDQREQAAPVDWEAVARRRERELKQVGAARHRAEEELVRLRAGEESGWDPMVVPTPGQWIARFNRASAAERLDVAQRVIGYTATAGTCFEMNHVRRLEEDRQAWVVLDHARQEVARWKLNTLEPQTARALDDIDRALREDHDPEPPPGFVPARSVARSWGEPSGDPLVVEPYRNDRGVNAWVFRCWGTTTCEGWLSLDHPSQESAERARERHVAEEHAGARATEPNKALPWSELSESGLLWLINRTVFHPRGLALTVHADDGTAYGWSLACTPGGEPWQFNEETDASGRERAEATLAAALTPTKEQQ